MTKEYVLIVVALGDGESNYGNRIHTERFRTHGAAELAGIWLKERGQDIRYAVVED